MAPHLTFALPGVPPDDISWRVRWCVFGTLGALMSDVSEPFVAQADVLVSRLVTVTAAALAAPADNRSQGLDGKID